MSWFGYCYGYTFGEEGPAGPISASIDISGVWYFLEKHTYLKSKREIMIQSNTPIKIPTKPATGRPATSLTSESSTFKEV